MKRVKVFAAAVTTLLGITGAYVSQAKEAPTFYRLLDGNYVVVTGAFVCVQSIETCTFSYDGKGAYVPISTGTYWTIP